MPKQPQIDFKFAKNWRAFFTWYDNHKNTPIWDIQALKIQALFDATNPNIVNWKQLWAEFKNWYKDTYEKKGEVKWSEQQRQIETLMLGQLKELNQEQFILVFLHKGKPTADPQVMTYWEATRVKEQLTGDKNGVGGDEDLDKITIVNLKNLIR